MLRKPRRPTATPCRNERATATLRTDGMGWDQKTIRHHAPTDWGLGRCRHAVRSRGGFPRTPCWKHRAIGYRGLAMAMNNLGITLPELGLESAHRGGRGDTTTVYAPSRSRPTVPLCRNAPARTLHWSGPRPEQSRRSAPAPGRTDRRYGHAAPSRRASPRRIAGIHPQRGATLPMDWALTQNHLGNVFGRLSDFDR